MPQSSSMSEMHPRPQESDDGDAKKRLRLDTVLTAVAHASGVVVNVAPDKVHNITVFSRLLSALLSPGQVTSCNEQPDAEWLILGAVEGVLAAYSELLVFPSAAEGEAVEWDPEQLQLSHTSMVNLHCLSLLLSHKPLFSLPVIAALFQCVILVVKHAPLQALITGGSRVLVALLDLLSCLPRGAPMDGMPSILRVTRITARNVMRRVGPHLFQQPPLDVNGKDRGDEESVTVAPVIRESAESSLIPWMERHLVPLHVVCGAAAQTELREDRRLALSLLEFVLYEDPDSREATASSSRITLQYLADAVKSLLEEDENVGGVTGHEREMAVAFLKRAENFLYCSEISHGYHHRQQQQQQGEQKQQKRVVLPQQSVPEAKVREFLLTKDAGYLNEHTQLLRHIEEERGTQEVLRRQLATLSSEHEMIYRDLKNHLNHASTQRDSYDNKVSSNGANFPSDVHVRAVLELIASHEEHAVAFCERQEQ